ncbi:MAG: M56 family metallopeptidase [Terriglobales bacterium]|jgi:Zn-dependent protease with chaperone function
MFALRGIAVSLACFVLLYGLVSALVASVWRALKPSDVAQRSVAALLFGLRILPLLASVVVTFALVVPSFQLLEPRSRHEHMSAMPLTLGVCALLLIAYGCFRVIAAQTLTNRVVGSWLEGAHPLNATASSTITFQSRRETPPLTLVGVCNPRVLVSDSTVALLSEDELQIALRHELEHRKSHDNLKKLIFSVCPFPGMAKLESAWSLAAELAADDAAVSNEREAVDLAAALVKLSRLVPVEAVPICAVGFVTASLSERVERLLAWDEASKARRVRIRTWFVVPFAVATSLLVTIAYGPVLALTHEVTEWLVR